jgi:hypothetical protein
MRQPTTAHFWWEPCFRNKLNSIFSLAKSSEIMPFTYFIKALRCRRATSLKESTSPATGPTEIPTPPPARLSCWSQAMKDIETSNLSLYKKLKEAEKKGKDALGLEKMLEERIRQHFKVPHWVEIALRFVLQFQNIALAAASLDLHKTAPIAIRGFCFILEVSR